jgi:hypothetical protein
MPGRTKLPCYPVSGLDMRMFCFRPVHCTAIKNGQILLFHCTFSHELIYWKIRKHPRAGWASVFRIWIRMTHKNRKNYEISCFEVMDFFLRVEGFSCSSDVLYGGLGIIKLQFYQKNI